MMPLMHFEGYDLVSRLGKGAYGTVYKARKAGDTELVAIKILWEGDLDDLEQAIQRNQPQKVNENYLRRFKEEEEILRSLRKFSQRNLGKAYVPLIKNASFSQADESQWNYLVMEYVDKPSIEDHLSRSREKRYQPLIPEAVALEITKRFIQLLSYLHTRGLYLNDAQFKNFRLTTIPETVSFDALDLVILDWNGTETFEEGRKRNLEYPTSYDIRSAISYLFHMLTGTSVFKEQGLSPRAIKQIAGNTWDQISPRTRHISLKVLSQTAGQFSRPILEEVIREIELAQSRWLTNAEDIPINENEAERYTVSDLLDGEWFAERSNNTTRKIGFQLLRQKGYYGRGERYSNAVRYFMSGQIGKALREYDPEVRESNLSREDLRWHLALKTLAHINDKFDLDDLAADFRTVLVAYPDEDSEDVMEWDKYSHILTEIVRKYADAPDKTALIQLLFDESLVMVDWLSVTSDKVNLAGAYQEVPESENREQNIALLQKAISFQQRLTDWASREPETTYRRLTLHALFNLTWNDSLPTVPEPSHQLDALVRKLQSRVAELTELDNQYEGLRKLAEQGEIAKLRNAFRGTERPSSELWRTLFNDVVRALTAAPNLDNREVISFAENYRDYLDQDSRERMRQLKINVNREEVREKLRNAATVEVVTDALKAAIELGVLRADPLQSDLGSLVEAWQDYERTRPVDLARARRSDKRRLLAALMVVKTRLAPVTASLGDIEVGLVSNIAISQREDLRELSGSHRLRYLLPYLVGLMVVAGLAISAIAFFAVNTSNESAASANATSTRAQEDINNNNTQVAASRGTDVALSTQLAVTVDTQSRNVERTATALQIANETLQAGANLTATAFVVEQAQTATARQAFFSTQEAAANATSTEQFTVINQQTTQVVGTQTALARTPEPVELTGTAVQAGLTLTLQVRTQSAQLAIIRETEVAENATRIYFELDTVDCRVTSTRLSDARVIQAQTFRDSVGAIAPPSSLGVLGSRTLRIVNQLSAFGELWLELEGFPLPNGSAANVFVRYADVVLANTDCSRLLLVTPTPTSTVMQTATATISAIATPTLPSTTDTSKTVVPTTLTSMEANTATIPPSATLTPPITLNASRTATPTPGVATSATQILIPTLSASLMPPTSNLSTGRPESQNASETN